MSSFLKKNTAVRICVGPFLDKTDGVTPEVALTVTNCHITATLEDDDNTAVNLIIDATATASGGSNDMVHITNDNAGYYDLELTAAQTNYNGRFKLAITDAANHCPVFHEFVILPEGVYDKEVRGIDNLREGRIQYKTTNALADRTGPISAEISKTNKPNFTFIHTQMTGSTMYDFDKRLLMGALIYDSTKNTYYEILGGYYFADDDGDTTRSVFGIAKDPNLFGCIENATITPYTASWTNAANEAASGNGWSFICARSTAAISASGDALQIWIDPNMIAEHQVSDYFDLQRLKLVNSYTGYALHVQADAHAMFVQSNNNNAIHAISAAGGVGIFAYGAVGGMELSGAGTAAGLVVVTASGARAINAKEIGEVFNIDGVTGASILDILKKIVDDAAGATYDATTDSLNAIRDRGDAAWVTGGASLTQQQVRDSMLYDASTSPVAAIGSIDAQLADIYNQGTATASAIAGLNDLSIADVQTAITNSEPIDANVTLIEGADATDTLATTAETGAGAALASYDPPTHTELINEIDAVQNDIVTLDAVVDTVKVDTEAIIVDIAALPTDGDVETAAGAALASYDPPTHAELISEIDAVQVDIANLDAVVDTVKVDTAAILVDTGTTLPTQIVSEIDAVQVDIANLDAVVDTVKVDTAAIIVDIAALPTDGDVQTACQAAIVAEEPILTTISGTIDSNVLTIEGVDATNALQASADAAISANADIDTLIAGVAAALKSTDTIDGVTVTVVLEVLQAMANGKFALNVPTAGYVTFYKRDNVTPLFVVLADATGRTRS